HRAPVLLEPLSSPFHGDHAEIFAGRLQRIFNGSSNIGMMFTRRQFGGASTALWSVDSRLKLSPNWVFAGQFMQSKSGVLSAGSAQMDRGNAIFAELRRAGRRFNSTTTYQDRDAAFAGNDLGFFRRADIRQLRQNLSYQWRPESSALLSAGPFSSAQAAYDHNDVLQDWYADLPMQFNFKGPTALSFGRMESFERYQEIGFRKSSSYITFSSDKWRVVGFRASCSQGKEINFFPPPVVPPALGNTPQPSPRRTTPPPT